MRFVSDCRFQQIVTWLWSNPKMGPFDTLIWPLATHSCSSQGRVGMSYSDIRKRDSEEVVRLHNETLDFKSWKWQADLSRRCMASAGMVERRNRSGWAIAVFTDLARWNSFTPCTCYAFSVCFLRAIGTRNGMQVYRKQIFSNCSNFSIGPPQNTRSYWKAHWSCADIKL